jgi:histone H3/H4
MKRASTSHRHSERSEESQTARLRKARFARLARECAKLDPKVEKAMAEEGMPHELSQWPDY